MEQIIHYIKERYAPLSIILYGSYAEGTNDQNSDFDALVISKQTKIVHDTSVVDGVILDVFVYPQTWFDEDCDPDMFVQIFDGRVLMDTDGIGEKLRSGAARYVQEIPKKTDEQIRSDIAWCEKMFERVKRCDAEGAFRWHWVLTDSLEIFCGIRRHPYLGPKKSLKWVERTHPQAYTYYQNALLDFRLDALAAWITYLKTIAL